MLKRIIDITLTASLIVSFTAGAAWALNRHEMHRMSQYMIHTAGFGCDGVKAMAPDTAEDAWRVRCAVDTLHHTYVINARTGEVWQEFVSSIR